MDNDVIDAAAGLSADSRLGLTRRQRTEVFMRTQGSHDVLVTPAEPGGVSRAERAAIALLVAEHDRDRALAAHYRALLDGEGGMPSGPRWDALQRHAQLVARAPGEATQDDIRRLEAVGLSAQDIVAVSQLIAFVSYQVRLLAGLRLLKQEA